MAWNNQDSNNPWGKNSGGQQPPDLDEVLKQMQNKFSGLFGKSNNKKSSDGGGTGGNDFSNKFKFFGSGIFIAIIVIIYILTGFYIVDPDEKGVVTQFGKYHSTTSEGPNWHIPWPVQSRQVINVTVMRQVPHQKTLMLTKDENIIDIDIAVQYNIKNPENYLFKVQNPDETVVQVVSSATRTVIGQNDMDVILTTDRSGIADKIKTQIQKVLDSYQTGIHIQTVNMQSAQPPEAVQAAFSDANKAREDKQRFINLAEAYRNKIVPLAQGEAKKILEEAKGYKEKVIKLAEGEANRFSQLYEEYRMAPEVTKKRLYLDTMEEVLSKTSKIVIDTKSNNIMYLPLDQILKQNVNPKEEELTTEQEQDIDTAKEQQKIKNQRQKRRIR
jgi:modulator of FtsH protease HflK